MIKFIVMIALCFAFLGCTYDFVKAGTVDTYYTQRHAKVTASMYNAELACYQLSGAVEAKNITSVKGEDIEVGKNMSIHTTRYFNKQCQTCPYAYDYKIVADKQCRACFRETQTRIMSLPYDSYNMLSLTNEKNLKIMEITQAKALYNKNSQVEQCLKRLDKPKQKLKTQCVKNLKKFGLADFVSRDVNNLSLFKEDLACFEELDKIFNEIIKEFSPKVKNITFTCSQGDEVLSKNGLKFSKDIENYALDTLQFKLVSKELSQNIAKNIAQDLDKNLFKDIDKKATDELVKQKSDDLTKKVACGYKMSFYAGNLNDLAMFRQSGVFADEIENKYNLFKNTIIKENNENPNVAIVLSDSSHSYIIKAAMSAGAINKEIAKVSQEIQAQRNKYKAYSKQERQKQNQQINKEIANLVIEKKKLEAMLNFIKGQ